MKKGLFRRDDVAAGPTEPPSSGPEEAPLRELPHFALADLTAFEKEVFFGSDPADGFVLSLALAYNDLKQIEWNQQIFLGASKPGVNPRAGQVFGMGIWASRFSYALLHELFKAISEANRRKVLESPAFRLALQILSPGALADWQNLLRLACGEQLQAAEQSALSKYDEIRNQASYHYANSAAILAGYHRFFYDIDSSIYNAQAYMSFDDGSLERTRFYFADAAAASLYDVGDADGEQLRTTTATIRRLVSKIVAVVIVAYIETRRLEPGIAGSPPVRPAARSSRRRRQRAKASSNVRVATGEP
jgi:hypothetical protein